MISNASTPWNWGYTWVCPPNRVNSSYGRGDDCAEPPSRGVKQAPEYSYCYANRHPAAPVPDVEKAGWVGSVD